MSDAFASFPAAYRSSVALVLVLCAGLEILGISGHYIYLQYRARQERGKASIEAARLGWPAEAIWILAVQFVTELVILILGESRATFGTVTPSQVVPGSSTVPVSSLAPIYWWNYMQWFLAAPVGAALVITLLRGAESRVSAAEVQSRGPWRGSRLLERVAVAAAQVMICCGASAALYGADTGGLPWAGRSVLFALGSCAGLVSGTAVLCALISAAALTPQCASLRWWYLIIFVVFALSWAAYACVFLVTAEGFGSISTAGAALGYGLANLFAVNTLAGLCWHVVAACQGAEDVEWAEPTLGMGCQSPADFLRDPAMASEPSLGLIEARLAALEAKQRHQAAVTRSLRTFAEELSPQKIVAAAAAIRTSGSTAELPRAGWSGSRAASPRGVASSESGSSSSGAAAPSEGGGGFPPQGAAGDLEAARSRGGKTTTMSPEDGVAGVMADAAAALAQAGTPPRATGVPRQAAQGLPLLAIPAPPAGPPAPPPTAIPELSGDLFTPAEADQFRRRLLAARVAQDSGDTAVYRAVLGTHAHAAHDRLSPGDPALASYRAAAAAAAVSTVGPQASGRTTVRQQLSPTAQAGLTPSAAAALAARGGGGGGPTLAGSHPFAMPPIAEGGGVKESAPRDPVMAGGFF